MPAIEISAMPELAGMARSYVPADTKNTISTDSGNSAADFY
jgi:hypothetical protein